MQILRIISMISVHILIILHIYVFGDSVIGSIDFQEFFHSFLKNGIINAGTILVMIAFLTTLIFGRFFCGWACHFGALQEFSWWVLKKFNITPKTINSRLVFLLPLFMLVYFYFTPNLLYYFSNPWHSPNIKLSEPEIWAFLPGFFIGGLTFIIDGTLIIYFLGRKGFCRYICPWGAFLKLPNAFAMFKVRNTGNCINTNLCTINCPVGIDVSYEINNFNKVTNTNCTSCLICTNGCPSNAITYQFMNPLKDKIQIKDYFYNPNSYKHIKIKSLFKSIRKHDYFLFILTLIFGFSIDGLYGMGHFLSFGIALIGSFLISQLLFSNSKKYIKYLYSILIVSLFMWHGYIKYSIWQGMNNFNNHNNKVSIKYLERVIRYYPKKISKFHIMLGEMYFLENNIERAIYHAREANNINPGHNSPKQLLELINKSLK